MVGDLPSRADGPAGLDRVRAASPAGVNVRTRVHEYGGGEYAVHADRLYFVDDADGGIHLADAGGDAGPVHRSASKHADLVVSPDGRWLFCVEERPRAAGQEPENRLLAIALDDSGRPAADPIVAAAGHDFYASTAVAPAGDEIAFLAWDHPDMPWNATVLETRAWGAEGPRGDVRPRAGDGTASLFQPGYAPDGRLFVVTDRAGYWNLARVGERAAQPVHRDRWEMGRAQWVFGAPTWGFADAAGQRVLTTATTDGLDRLVELGVSDGAIRERPSSLVSIASLVTGEGWAACVGGAADRPAALHLWRVAEGAPTAVRESSTLALPEDTISRAEAVSFASASGRTAHAFVYRPRSGAQTPLAGERPPLLVKSHGGPTAGASAALDPRIQFWTSRGFCVVDVNYAGSTGFGRAYRDVLHERWGVVDVEDCVAAARTLADEGVVDGARLAISGGSAGGYTTLCALTFHDAFAAGASHYGIGDLEALARDTHKFESRYTDWLVGPLPETADRYRARSPIHHAARLARPVIFFQGLEDRVVPPSQAEAMVAVLAERGLPHAYVPFEGEQHGFRRAENIRTALDGELYFYGRVFGFDAPRPAGVEVVGGSG